MKKFAFLLLFFPVLLFSQQQITMADAILKGRTALSPANLKQLQWIPGTAQFSHIVGGKIVRMDANKTTADTLDWQPLISAALTAQGKTPPATLPPFTWLDAERLWFQNGDDIFIWSQKGGLEKKTTLPAGAGNVDIHPKTLAAAYTLDGELHITGGDSNKLIAKSEAEGIVYGTSVHRDEFGIHKGTYWSPSGQRLAFYRMDESMVTKYPVYLLDSMPAQVKEFRYPFAGSKSHHVTVGIFNDKTNETVYLETGEPAEQYLTNIAWSPDEKFLLVAVLNRGQNHLWLKQFDAESGAFVKTIFEETNEKWVEPEHPAEFVPGSNTDFIWQSERDGFNHLYLYNLSGKMLRQVSFGNAPVTNFLGFSDNGKRCFFQMADNNGLERYCYTAEVYPQNGMTRLYTEAGIHNALINSTGEWALDLYSSATTPREISVLPVKKPEKRRVIFSAPNPVKDIQMGETRLVALNSPGGVPLNARLILPTNFDPNKKYPALVYVYNGPHVQMVTNSWLNGGELWMHRMAELGVAVFVLDGRGSENRGFAFESAIFRHCGDAEVADQLVGANYLKSQPFIDSTRLGVFGWSYGGFMATSLMTRPEAKGVFRCGVAGGPVIDWRMYEIMYTERYMDSPQENPEGYEKASLFNYIDNLNGRLLMIHGSSDDVVLWQHSLRYIRECVRKGKQIDYFVYPEHLHNVMGKDRVHLYEKVEKFFLENLRDTDGVRP